MPKKTLTGRRVAITGGARGIGRATAQEFIARGAAVVIGDLDAELVQKTAAEIAESTGGRIVGLSLDVTSRESFAAFLDAAESELGDLDVLVNNAGIMPTGPFVDESDAVTDRQIAINITGVITGSKLASQRFIERGSGHIVNIASLAGVVGVPGTAVYCATKHAVVGLGSTLHQELAARGVKVSTVCPGFVRTELIAGINASLLIDKLGIVDPEDVANDVVDAVESDKGGLRFVPRFTSVLLKALSTVPENFRNSIAKSVGLHSATLHTDESIRAAYRARIEK